MAKQLLGDLIEIHNNKRVPLSSVERADFQGEYPYYGAQSIVDYVADFRFDGEFLLVAEDGENLRSRKSPIASIARGKFWVNNHAHALTARQGIADLKFIEALLNSLDITAYVTGAAQPKLSMGNLRNIVVTVPDYQTQARFGQILKDLSELETSLQKQISLLEEAARLIYTEWFIWLRFPGHKRGSAGARELPNGWEATTIGAVSSYINRGVAPTYDEASPKTVINQKCIRDGKLDLESARNLANDVTAEKWLQKGDVLINSTGTGTLGRIAQVREELDSVTVDTHVTIVRPKAEISPCFFGQQLLRMEAHFEALGEGATNQTELKRDRIRDTSFLLPTPQVMADFDATVEPMIEQIEVLRKQIAQLRQARDLLLPRLISGQLRL